MTEERQTFKFSDLRVGDRIFLDGDGDIMSQSVVVAVHPHEVVVHWHELPDHKPREVRILGTYVASDEDVFGPFFFPIELFVEGGDAYATLLFMRNDRAKTDVVGYIRIVRDGRTIFEVGSRDVASEEGAAAEATSEKPDAAT